MKRRNNENRQRKEGKNGRDSHVLRIDVLKRNDMNNRRMKRHILKVASMSKEVLKNVKIFGMKNIIYLVSTKMMLKMKKN